MSSVTQAPKRKAVVRLDRWRLGEWIMFVASLALVVDIAAFPWYSERAVYANGVAGLTSGLTDSAGQAFPVLTGFAIVCAMLTWAICIAQLVLRGPAVPLAMTVIATILDIVLCIWLLIRVVFDQPKVTDLGTGANQIKPDVASVAGLFLAVVLLYGAWRALRTDGLAAADNPRRIETLRLAPRSR